MSETVDAAEERMRVGVREGLSTSEDAEGVEDCEDPVVMFVCAACELDR